MNITKTDLDPTRTVLKIQIGKEDYEPKIQKALKEYQHKINLKGFRQGMVPTGIIKKMYGKSILVEEINKIVIDSLFKFISENKLKVLGEPLPSENDNKPIDWDNQEEFDFSFDIALSPEIDVKLSENDNFCYYNVQADDHLLNLYIDNYTTRYGSYKASELSEGNELLKGDIVQLDKDNNYLETGIKSNDISFLISAIKDEEIKNKFIGVKVNDKIIFDPKSAFPNVTDLTAMLKIDKSKATAIENNFEFTVKEIQTWTKSEINQQLFDNIYGKDVIKTEEEFKEKINEEIKMHLLTESEYKFKVDCKENLLSKINFDLPNDFLKRWLLESGKFNLTKEKIDEEYSQFEKDIKWQLIKENIIDLNNITATDEEIQASAKEALLMQYRQYGLTNIPEEYLEKYSKELLEKKEEKQKFLDKKLEDKVFDFVKSSVILDIKDISHDEFEKLFEN